MKRIAPIMLLSAAVLSETAAIDATVTRAQLLQMYHAANRATDRTDAIKKWSEIVQEAPGLAKPYLQIAKLYDADSLNSESRDMAILFYRKYMDVEMDSLELADAEKRLSELEGQVNAPSFRDYLKNQADSIDNVYSQLEAEAEAKIENAVAVDTTAAQPPVVEAPTKAETIVEDSEPKTPLNLATTEADVLDSAKVEEAAKLFNDFADSLMADSVAADTVVADSVVVPKEEIADNNPQPESKSATTIAISPTISQPVADNSDKIALELLKSATSAGEYNEELLFPVEKNEERTMQIISQSKDVVATDIIGRWVSQSRLPNNTVQTWIIDIEKGVYGLMARAEVMSGALSQKFDKTDNRADLQELFANETQITDIEDVNYETMCLFSNIDKLEVPVIVANNCVSIKLNASKNYTTNSSRMMSSVFSLSKIKNVIKAIANSDDQSAEMEEAVKSFAPFSFSAEVEFTLQFAETGLVGHATEIVADQNDGKTIIMTKHSFDTKFYRVGSNDTTIGIAIDLQKSESDVAEEQALISHLSSQAAHDSEIAYQLGILLTKGLGDINGKANENDVYKFMTMAANDGHQEAMKYLISSGYKIAGDESYPKATRQKNIEIAEHWIKVLSAKSPSQAVVAQIPKAKYLLDTQNDVSAAMKIYNMALATRAPEAMIAAGDFYASNGKQDKAIELYNSAIDMGSSDAILSLANAYKNSDTGKYVDLVLQAHEKGNIEALNNLYEIYLDGIGVDQDYHKANAYYMEYRRAENKAVHNIIQALQK